MTYVRPQNVSEPLSRYPLTLLQLLIASVAAFALVIDGLDIQLLSLVSPIVLNEWHVSRPAFGPALAAAMIGMSFGAHLGGWLGDRYGRKRVLTCAMMGFGIATIGASATDSVLELTTIRLISGIGFGAAAPNGLALAAEWVPPRLRARLAAILSVGTPLGGFLGGALLLWLLPLFGWRGCFVICGVFTALLGLAMFSFLPESPGFESAKTEVTSRTSLFTREYFRATFGTAVVFFSMAFVVYAVITWSPALLTAKGFALSEALHATMALNIAAVAGGLMSSFLIDRFGSRPVLFVCAGGVLICLAVLVWALMSTLTPTSKLLTTLAIGGCGGFTGAALATVYSLLTCIYPASCRAAGIGFGMMMGRLGSITTILLSGYLLSDIRTVVPFGVILAIATLFAVLGTLVVDRHLARAFRAACDTR